MGEALDAVKLEATIHVLAGAFASQQLAFAHLLDVAQRDGLSPDFDHVEIVPPDHPARLRHYFDDALAEELRDAAGEDAIILILPGALITGAYGEDHRLRDLGLYPAHVFRALP